MVNSFFLWARIELLCKNSYLGAVRVTQRHLTNSVEKFKLLQNLWPAQATNKSIGIALVLSLAGLLLTTFVLERQMSFLCAPLHALIIATLVWICFQRPFWGLVLVVSSAPLVKLLPSVPPATSLVSVLGGATFLGYIFHELLLRRAKPVVLWTHVVGVCLMLWITLSNPSAALMASERSWTFTYIQLIVLMFLTTQLCRTSEHLAILFGAFVTTAVTSGTYAILATGFFDSTLEVGRGFGFDVGPNLAATHFIIGMIFAFYFLLSEKRASTQVLAVAALAILTIAFATTGSRGGLLSLALAFLCSVWIFAKFRPRFVPRKSFIVAMAGLVAAFGLIDASSNTVEKTKNLFGRENDPVGFRLEQWNAGLEMAAVSPMRGLGIGQYQTHIPFVNTDTYPQIGMGFGAHNSFVSDLAETGVVGLAMTLALWGVAIQGLIRLLRRNEPVFSSKGVVLLLVLIVFLGASLVGNRGTIKLIWVLFGLCETQPVHLALASFVSLFRRAPSSEAASRIAQPA